MGKARRYFFMAMGAACLLGCLLGALLLLAHYMWEAESAGTALEHTGETGETGQRSEYGAAEGRERAAEAEAPPDLFRSVPDESIRVSILGNNYEGVYHEDVTVSAAGGLLVEMRQREGAEQAVSEEGGAFPQKGGIAAGLAGGIATETENLISVWSASSSGLAVGGCCALKAQAGGGITIETLQRAQGTPKYTGTLWIYRESVGYRVVNELPLEEYLAGVVSSEMPSDYPEEALKAQAVAARTYAVRCMETARGDISGEKTDDFSSDLDDSVSFQVYNNQETAEAARNAVEATAGEILDRDEVRYYSTSCGTRGREDLGSEEGFRAFLLAGPEEGAEYGSPWLRWFAAVSREAVGEILSSAYGFRGAEADELEVGEREGDGRASELVVSGGGQSAEIAGEYQIRRVLSPESGLVVLRDGTEMKGMSLLPSAFFCVWESTDDCERESGGSPAETETVLPGEAGWAEGPGWSALKAWLSGREGEYFLLCGGGYGHGEGMSQCGAAAMAAAGADYREILNYYYGNG